MAFFRGEHSDPAKGLLALLRSQDAVRRPVSQNDSSSAIPSGPGAEPDRADDGAASDRIFALLGGLTNDERTANGSRPAQVQSRAASKPEAKREGSAALKEAPALDAERVRLRNLTVTQAMPLLRRLLSHDAALRQALLAIREEQHGKEASWWQARRDLEAKWDREIQEAERRERTAAPLAAAAPGPSSAFPTAEECRAVKREGLRSYDGAIRRRWSEEIGRQQAALEHLGIPCFYRTSERLILERQQRVMDELNRLLDADDPSPGEMKN